jgi:hypothetical protein
MVQQEDYVQFLSEFIFYRCAFGCSMMFAVAFPLSAHRKIEEKSRFSPFPLLYIVALPLNYPSWWD